MKLKSRSAKMATENGSLAEKLLLQKGDSQNLGPETWV